jgi:hypothetical protein
MKIALTTETTLKTTSEVSTQNEVQVGRFLLEKASSMEMMGSLTISSRHTLSVRSTQTSDPDYVIMMSKLKS